MIHQQHFLVPPARMPEARDGSFSMTGNYGTLPPPVALYGWTPGMGEMTAQEKMTAALAAVTAAGNIATQAILAPKLAREDRRVAEAQAELEAIKAQQRGESLRQAIKTAGTAALVIGGAYLLLSGGRAIFAGRRRS